MYYATVAVHYSTGGWVFDPFRYFHGVGYAMCHSPKQASYLARRRAERAANVPDYMPVMQIELETKLVKL